jgi:hypothetical protein
LAKLTDAQQRLVLQYEDYSIDDLFTQIGKEATQSANAAVQERYVLGTPDVHKRGRRIVEDARSSICSNRTRLEELARKHQDSLEPVQWVGEIMDVVLAVTVTSGVPPITVAMALGKLCNRTLSKLCAGA